MRHYDATNLVVHPGNSSDPAVIVEITPALAGWEYINFQVRQLAAQAEWAFDTTDHELAIIVLSGCISVRSNRGEWPNVGQRDNVFSGPAAALYLPRQTTFSVSAARASEFAVAWVAADQDFAPRMVHPDELAVEIRGGDNATRQINAILPPGFPCQRLVVVEVYTPSGNWSSYPPHKHDLHITDPAGNLLEADLEEIYFYKLDRPEGYAHQHIYTAPESPLAQAGYPIDALVIARNNDVVIVPEGYHPVASAPGYTTYYLNVLAGSAQSLANSDDPRYAWIKTSYTSRDPRVPIYASASQDAGQ